MSAALSPTCTPIIKAIRALGFYEGRANAQFSRATHEIEGVSTKVTDLTRRLIKSRIIELKIVEHRVPSDERRVIEEDRKELEALLAEAT